MPTISSLKEQFADNFGNCTVERKAYINCILEILLVIMTCGYLVFTFVNSDIQRSFLFLTAGVSLFYVLNNCKVIYSWALENKLQLIFILSILVVALSKIIWAYWQFSIGDSGTLNDRYYRSGQRVLITIVVFAAYAILGFRGTSSEKLMNWLRAAVFLSLACAIGYGLYGKFALGQSRIDFNLGYATTGAYLFEMIAALGIFAVPKFKGSIFVRIALFVICYVMLCFTQTRNAMIMFPFCMGAAAMCYAGDIKRVFANRNAIVGVCLAVIVGIGACIANKSIFISRIAHLSNDIAVYQQTEGNKVTSVGARFSMYVAGAHCFSESILGSSRQQRIDCVNQYVESTGKHKAAETFVKNHLHNEIIDTASLQGIFGVVALLALYVSGLLLGYIRRYRAFLALMFVYISMGLSDCIVMLNVLNTFCMIALCVGMLLSAYRPENN